MSDSTDVLICGCGIAGATTALRIARDRRRKVTVLTITGDPMESSTGRAQGGIVAAYPEDDTLVADILRASGGTSRLDAANLLANEGGALIQQILIDDIGVHFDIGDDGLPQLGREGGHSRRRILHVGDRTGKMIARALLLALKRQPNVTLLTRATALDLILTQERSGAQGRGRRRCAGAWVLESDGVVRERRAAATVLATGGIGQLYAHTTNPPTARGDGLAMAVRARARITDAEFVQFHPTAVDLPGANSFLVSEAVRGEGGTLMTPDGRAFMEEYSPDWGDLAPRDVVSYAIHDQMDRFGYPHVFLDIASKLPAETIRARFPTIFQTLLAFGLDITREPIPVRPAAHYFCGGIAVDRRSRSSVEALYAVGEVSNTGLHGANRLASTSLLEGLVWAAHAADDIEERIDSGALAQVAGRMLPPSHGKGKPAITPKRIGILLDEVRSIMWQQVGIVRTPGGLRAAIDRLGQLQAEIDPIYRASTPTDALAGLRNALDAGLQIARSAARRRQSVGCHVIRGDVGT